MLGLTEARQRLGRADSELALAWDELKRASSDEARERFRLATLEQAAAEAFVRSFVFETSDRDVE